MKKLTSVLISLGFIGTLTACNNGGSGKNVPTTSASTQASLNSSKVSSSSIAPQLNMEDAKMIFAALATSADKKNIDTQTAVNIINGVDSARLNTLLNLPTSGYESALKTLQVFSPYPTNSVGDRSKYNEALFAAIFLADVTDSSSGSDGTSSLGTISLDNTVANFAMVSHRFFGGERLAQQHYTWSVNPGTFTSILNINPIVGSAADISYLNVHQGAVGDCYFLSTLSSLINARGSQAILDNIKQDPTGYSLKYTNIHSVDSSVSIGEVTDLQIATGAYSNGSGNWLNIYEQAFGSVLMSGEYNFVFFGNNIPSYGIYSLPTFYAGMVSSVLPIGQYYPAFKFLTGHEVYEFSLDYNNANDSSFKNIYLSNNLTDVNFATQTTSGSKMIDIIDQALLQHRVIVLGTPVDTNELNPGEDTTGSHLLPIDVVGTHAYAVLGHANGKFELRNPWGTNFTPTGPDSIANGYTMKNGVFYVPDQEVFKLFTQVDIEQLPGLDKTPQVINGQVVKVNGKVSYTNGTNKLFANYLTSNQDFIQDNYTGSQISTSKLNFPNQ